jgi:RNAse (barnase) inhibitor barstar
MRLTQDVTEPLDTEQVLAELGVTARVLDGKLMRTKAGLIDEFASRLAFPDYFGRNWDALADCLADLDWLRGLAYAFVIHRASELLADEPPAQISAFFQLIEQTAAQWAQPVSLGEAWDRSAIPFHLLLDDSAEHLATVQPRVGESAMVLPDLSLEETEDSAY